MCTSERFEHVIRIIAAVVRNIHLKRALQQVDLNPELNFWRLMHGNCLDMAIIDWCKLFGSDNNDRQQMHWKNLIPEEQHDKFRAILLAATGLSAEAWQAYRDEVKIYRDQQAAHFDVEFLQPERNPRYPDLSAALEATYCYYDHLLQLAAECGLAHAYPRDIRDYGANFERQAVLVARAAFSATGLISEQVR